LNTRPTPWCPAFPRPPPTRPRERATLAETAYTVLRKKLLFEHLAPSGSGPAERRLAILGFAHWQDEEARRATAGPARAA
jgi:16S rRNA (cytosine967-C5)-methyltransferase